MGLLGHKGDPDQLHSCNTDNHSAYLTHVQCKFQSLYPHGHVTDVSEVMEKLKANPEFLKAEQISTWLKETFQKSPDNS